MKKLLCLLFFFFTGISFAQTHNHFSCAVEEPNGPVNFSAFNMSSPPVYSGSVDPAVLATYPPISFDIYFWVINKSDGSNDYPITNDIVLQNIKKLNEFFEPMNICFVLKGHDTINNTALYDGQWSAIKSYVTNPNNNYRKVNAFNIYIPPTILFPTGTANGISGTASDIIGMNSYHFGGYGQAIIGNTLAHEIAHSFALIHPWGPSNGSLTTAENITRDPADPNYNALTTADKVHDTPPMGAFYTEAKLYYNDDITAVIDSDCNYITGLMTDGLGAPIVVTPYDVGNIMGYTRGFCIHGFTVGQGIRIREYIAVSPAAPAVMAMRPNPIALDLYIKDSPEDFGEEPNTVTAELWNSNSIWVRKLPDNIKEHQNPEYDPVAPNYVYIKVTNRGCDASTGTETVKLYWSKASTSLNWDYHWAGNNFPNSGPSYGNIIGTLTIPVLEPGEEAVLQFTWNNVPDPADYNAINPDPWHFCLLARITATGDPMAVTEVVSLPQNVGNNNNIAWKNLSVVDLDPNTSGRPTGGVVAVGNLLSQATPYNLNFYADRNEVGTKIFTEAEVSIILDNMLLTAWTRGGKLSTGIVADKVDTRKFYITGDNAAFKNLKFNPGEVGTLNLKFNFLTQQVTAKEKFTYHVAQTNTIGDKVYGGETYEIRKKPRTLFVASADNAEVDRNESVVLSAAVLNEPALYNWYDSDGALIYEGADFAVSTEVAKQYKLEVIALNDGYKDYTDISVNMKPDAIEAISPNPSSGIVSVGYKVNSSESAYLSITGFYGSNNSDNYIIDVEQNEINIDVTNYVNGFYIVSLIINGEVVDTKTLMKQ